MMMDGVNYVYYVKDSKGFYMSNDSHYCDTKSKDKARVIECYQQACNTAKLINAGIEVGVCHDYD